MSSDLTVKKTDYTPVIPQLYPKDKVADNPYPKPKPPVIFTGRNSEGGHWSYTFRPDKGTLEICNYEDKICSIMEDTDQNGKFDRGKVISFDSASKKDKILSEVKLDENENDVETTARKYLDLLQQQDKEYHPPKINIKDCRRNFKQGQTGDCGLLAIPGAFLFSKKGPRIIKTSFSTNYKEGIGVKLQGVDETYFITPEEIRDSEKRLSVGNDAIRALELAVEKREKYKLEELKTKADKSEQAKLDRQIKAPINSGFHMDEAFKLLTKNKIESVQSYNYTVTDNPANPDYPYWLVPRDPLMDSSLAERARQQNKKAEEILNAKKQNPNRFLVTASFIIPEYALDDNAPYDASGKGIPHAVIVKKVNKNSIIFVNTWDTSKEIRLPRKGFTKEYVRITSCDLRSRRRPEDDAFAR